jgi:hypothetical protein
MEDRPPGAKLELVKKLKSRSHEIEQDGHNATSITGGVALW